MVNRRRNTHWKCWPSIAIFTMFAGACNQMGGIESATLRQCAEVQDCVVEISACREALACHDGRCIFQDAPQGAPFTVQAAGDCSEVVCDGKGGTETVAVADDVPDDGNPCTRDTCDKNAPHVPIDEVPCFSGPSWKIGKSSCKGGIQHCTNGKLDPVCEGEVPPAEEDCDWQEVDEDCDGQTNEEGPSCLCVPGEVVECYTGPENTAGFGNCHLGHKACKSNGLEYGPCIDEQTPMEESCDPGMLDEDCDGDVNESGAYCFCGDGFVMLGVEICDDGNNDSTDACKPNCEPSICGDGIVQPILNETCDDGNLDSTDMCTALCRVATCGDGIIQPILGEVCDDNNTDPNDACSETCTSGSICGNGIAQFGEGCDDGNTVDGDGCPADCKLPAVTVAAGGDESCAVFSDGSMKCWGYTMAFGLSGVTWYGAWPKTMGGYLPRVDLGLGQKVKSLAAHFYHSCVIFQNDSVKCWGKNEHGQLGLGDVLAIGSPFVDFPPIDLGTGRTAKVVSVGREHTCAILDNGKVKCWGAAPALGLGLGLDIVEDRGDDPGEMGNNLPTVALGTGRTAKAITTGESHTCVILDNDSLKCWGDNFYGQLGLGINAESRGVFPGEMGDALPSVNLGTGKFAKAIAAGSTHTCAILNDDTLKCWGDNELGQLGLGFTGELGIFSTDMGDNLPVVDLGTGRKAIGITAGKEFTCALLDNKSVKCWGFNYPGKLGIGWPVPLAKGDNPDEMGDNLPAVDLGKGAVVEEIRAGQNYACVLLQGGIAKCWGENSDGQLGQEDTESRGWQYFQMGDSLLPIKLW